MSSWTGDVDESEDDTTEADDGGFEATLNRHVDEGTVVEIGELALVKGVDDVDSPDLLRQAHRQLEGSGNEEKLNLVEKRLKQLDEPLPDTESDVTEDEPEDDSDTEESDGWGGTPVDEADDLDEDDDEDSEAAEPAIESVEEMDDEEEDLGGETPEDTASSLSEDSDGEPTPSTSISVKEAADRERRWKVLVWGPPGLFKSHFAYTAPEPVAYIDTERKAHDIAHKFSEREIQIWQPEDFRETQEALQEAKEWLNWWMEEKGERGTIVVDSMSLVWEWAKTAYKTEAYPMKDNEEVTLSSNMGSSQESDWQHIKGMHNSEFRQWITDSPYHFVWTAGETEDYGAVMEGDSSGPTPMKPEGEKNNVHKADSIIRARKDNDGHKVGDLTKSNFTDHLFIGLERPTFPKLRDTIEEIESAETSPSPVDKNSLESELGVRIVRGDPKQYEQD